MSDEVRISDRDGVRCIELCRPRSKNGLTLDTNQAIIDALGEASEREELRAVILTGAEGNFCSGLDLKDALKRGPQTPATMAENLDRYFHGLIRAIAGSPLPTIAAIDGVAVGFGADLALACDIRLMSEGARFGEIFVRRGLMPDGGSTYHLSRLIGVGRALELMLTGDIIDAETALRMGLCNHVYPAAELSEQAWSLAARIAKGPPIAQRHIKACVRASMHGTLDEALAREREGQVECLQSRDFAEGVTAFFTKREPEFSGK